MPITTNCPGCQALFELPDDMAGMEVRCQQCERRFVVPGLPAEAPLSAPEPANTAPAPVNEKLASAKARPPADAPVSVAGSVVLLLLFGLSLLAIGGMAAAWIAIHLESPLPSHLAVLPSEVRVGRELPLKKPAKDLGPGPKQAGFVHRIIVGLDAKGEFVDTREMTENDPRAWARGEYKEYLVMMEKGVRYRLEMALRDLPTSVTLFDPDDVQVADVFNRKNANITHVAQKDGLHRLRAAAPVLRQRYQLRIAVVP